MATKQVTGLGKLGLRVAATTADRARNERAMQGVIARCADVVPPGTTSITLEEAQYYAGRQIQFEITSVRERDNAHVAGSSRYQFLDGGKHGVGHRTGIRRRYTLLWAGLLS